MIFLGLGYSELSIAVLQRSIEGVRRLSRDGAESSKDHLLDTLELALGWAEGLAFFISVGHDPTRAIKTACLLRDAKSLSIILNSEFPIFGEWVEGRRVRHNEDLWLFSAAVDSRDLEVQKVVVESFKERRKELNALALTVFSEEERLSHGLSADSVLDANASRVYRLLKSKIDVLRGSTAAEWHRRMYFVTGLDHSLFTTFYTTLDSIS